MVLGLLLIPPNVWFVIHGLFWGQSRPTTVSLIFNVVASLLLLAALNALLGRVKPRWALSHGEMLVIYGMLSVAGLISMILGSLMLFKGAGPEYQVAWQVFLPTVLLISAFFVTVATLVVRAHVRPPFTGAEGLIGEVGTVKAVDGAGGKVQVHGELWRAEFEGTVTVGDRVRVVALENLTLRVAPETSEKE